MKMFFKVAVIALGLILGLLTTVAAPAAARETALSAVHSASWQTNGTVRTMVYANGKLFVGGEFTSVRPPGAAVGTQENARSYLAVFNAASGTVLSVALNPNGQVWALSASPDQKTVYVGGDFTQIGGVGRGRIAAIDTTTLAVAGNFRPYVSYRVAALDVTANTVYLGGSFGVVAGVTRNKVAAVSVANGAVLPWDPNADHDVLAVKAAPDGSKVYLGGRFATIGGQNQQSVALVDADLGGIMAFAAQSAVPNRTSSCWSKVQEIITHNDVVYFANAGDGGGCFDGTWAANIDTGQLVWRNNCLGATEAIAVVGGWLYKGSHAHDCSTSGGFPEGGARMLLAQSLDTGEVKGWHPNTNGAGATKVGPWAMATDGVQLWVGGDFTTVNGSAQQGLTLFKPTPEAAPRRPATPSASSSRIGVVKVMYQSTLDNDDENLTYRLFRNNSSIPLETKTIRSRFWDQPASTYLDSGLTPGAQVAYRVEVSDGTNVLQSFWTPYLSVASTNADYPTTVQADGAKYFWPMDETSGSTAADVIGGNTLTTSGASLGSAGSNAGDKAASLNTTSSKMTSTISQAGPQEFTAELWFNSTTNRGGRILGFGNERTNTSGSYDRQIYLGNDGRVNFGVYPGSTVVIQGSSNVADGQWHHIVATMAPGHSELYVDGVSQGSANPSGAQGYNGFWRLGADNLSGWPNQPSNSAMIGRVDNVAIYPTALASDDVSWHYALGLGSAAPLAEFSEDCTLLACTFDGTASNTNSTVASYAWDFGDGGTVTGATPTHAFAVSGTYPVKLTTTGTSGGTATVTKQVIVQGANQLPTAAFTNACTALACSFDGTASTDPDGTITSYAWDFGDGATASTATANHSYAAGTYTVSLTVTDNRGGVGTTTKAVTVEADNQMPTAAFTNACTALACSFDGTASTDPDGTITSYAWDFGDGATASTATANHSYAAGTYTVSLTVTDNRGGVGTTAKVVTVQLANQSPTAAFTNACTALSCNFNGTDSTDPEGSIASYAWNFGDGSTATTAIADHSYSAAGTYTVTLTVGDNQGATNVRTSNVTVQAATPVVTVLAKDDFNRTVARGLGNATVGGAWTVAGSVARYAVTGGTGQWIMATAGNAPAASLNGVQAPATDTSMDMALDKSATGGGVYFSLSGRSVTDQGEYRAKIRYVANGNVYLALVRTNAAGAETYLTPETLVQGLTPAVGEKISVRLQVVGQGTTELKVKLWRSSTPEPAAWRTTVSDSTPALQQPGAVALRWQLSGSSTNSPVTAAVSNLLVTTPR